MIKDNIKLFLYIKCLNRRLNLSEFEIMISWSDNLIFTSGINDLQN
jgi:hypothetical protein